MGLAYFCTEKLAHVPQIRCTMEIKRDIYLMYAKSEISIEAID
jgi:hypothetical protein